MLQCAHCQSDYKGIPLRDGFFFCCERCRGIAVTFSLLRRHVPALQARTAWASVKHAASAGHACPSCQMDVSLITASELAPFSLCSRCQLAFFTSAEKHVLPSCFHQERKLDKLAALTKQERLDYAESLAQLAKDKNPPPVDGAASPLGLLYAKAGLLVPHSGFPDLTISPVTKFILIMMFAVTALLISPTWAASLEPFVAFHSWGFFEHGGFNFVVSFFSHGGLWHLLANAHYLRAFGPLVEHELGTKRFLTLIVLSEVIGGVLFSLSSPEVGSVGASGGIMAILTFYCLIHPKEKVGFAMIYSGRSLWFPIWSVLIFLSIQNLLGAVVQLGGNGPSQINYLAHIGGIMAGGLAFWWARRREPASGHPS